MTYTPRIIMKISFLVAGLLFVFSKVRIHALIGVISEVYLPLFGLVFLFFLFNLLVSGSKWWMIMTHAGVHLSRLKAIYYYCHGYVYNFILPTSVGGDIIKAHSLKKEVPVSFRKIYFTTLVDRFTGLIALCILVLISFLIMDWKKTTLVLLSSGLVGFGALFCVTLILFFLHRIKFSLVSHLHLVQHVQKFYQDILDTQLVQPLFQVKLISVALLFHIIGIYAHFLLFQSLHIQVTLSEVFMMLSVMRIAEALPISFGGFGIRETVLILFTRVLPRISPSEVVAYALLAYILPLMFVSLFLIGKIATAFVRKR